MIHHLQLHFLFRFNDPECYPELQSPFARALICLDKQPWRVLESWFGSLQEGDRAKRSSYFRSLVRSYTSVVVHILKKRHRSARPGGYNAELEVRGFELHFSYIIIRDEND